MENQRAKAPITTVSKYSLKLLLGIFEQYVVKTPEMVSTHWMGMTSKRLNDMATPSPNHKNLGISKIKIK